MTKKEPRFCDPTVGFAFKRIFGSELYKDATIGFINSLLTDRAIRDVSFMNVEIPGFTVEDRKSCVDVLCTGDDGSNFVIEMQVVEQDYFRQRTVLYASTLISHLAERGHNWDYHLRPTYVISVIDLTLNENGLDSCISHFTSREVIPDGFQGDRAFLANFEASEKANMTKEERILYDHAMITKTDIEYGKEYSFRKGFEKGEAKGKAEGRAEVAKKLLEASVDISVIQDSTGLSRKEIECIL